MAKNVGTIDRAIRFAAVLGIAYGYYTGALTGLPLTIAAVLGVVFLATGASAVCPLYTLVGLNTRGQ